MTEKEPSLEKKLNETGIPVAMPISHLSVLSNVDNITRAMHLIQEHTYSKRPVIGFQIVRSVGARERDYMLMSQEHAETLKAKNPRFSYVKWDELVRRKSDISRGKYRIHNGTIVGIDPKYL